MRPASPSKDKSLRDGLGSSPGQPSPKSARGRLRLRLRGAQASLSAWHVQLVFMVLTLLHCGVYMLGPSQLENFGTFVLLVWLTGAPLAALTVLEFLVRVAVQGGKLWRWRSWTKFFIPLYHRLEAMVFAVAVYRGFMTCYLLFVVISRGEMPPGVSDQDKATVLVLCGYRVLRCWGIWHGISVEQTLKSRKKHADSSRVWMDEHKVALSEYNGMWRVRAWRWLDSLLVQTLMLILTVLYCVADIRDWHEAAEVGGYFLLSVFAFEFGVRAKAQGGERFFTPCLHKFEVCILAAGTFCLFYATWYTEYLAEAKGEAEVYETAIPVLLSMHRLCRYLAIRMHVSGSRHDADDVMSAKAMQIFNAKFGDIMEVPPQNVRVNLRGSSMHLEKAHLKPEAFKNLHLPFAVESGIIEELFVDLFLSKDGVKAKESQGKTRIRLRNIFLKLSPGPGLLEAGGMAPSNYWEHGKVLEGKSRLVDLICKRLQPPAAAGSLQRSKSWRLSAGRNAGREGYQFGDFSRALLKQTKTRVGMLISQGMQKFGDLLKQSSLRHLSVEIENVSVQLDDLHGQFGLGHATVSAKVGQATVFRSKGHAMEASISRATLCVETRQRDCWRTGLFQKSESPKILLKEMVRQDRAQCLRLCTFVEVEERRSKTDRPLSDRDAHRWRERWPERNLVVTLLHATFSGFPRPEMASEASELGTNSQNLFGRLRQRVSVSLGMASEGSGQAAAISNGADSGWTWKASVKPVTLSADNDQLRFLRLLLNCFKAWNFHDEAMRWRPELRPCAKGLIASPRERRVIVHLWWLYALHRVLARQKRRPKTPFVELAWQSHYCRRYSALLAKELDIAGPLAPGRRLVLKPRESVRDQLRELQLHLSYPMIISCYKRELASAVERHHHIQMGLMLKRVASGPGKENSTARHQEMEEEDIDESEDEDEEDEEDDEDSESDSGDEDLATSSSLPALRGDWQLCLERVDLRALRWIEGENRCRPVLLHFQLRDIRLGGDVEESEVAFNRGTSPKDVTPERRTTRKEPMHKLVTLVTVKGASITCPDAGAELSMGVQDLLKVMRPVKLEAQETDSPCKLAGADVGEEFAFTARASIQPGQLISLEVGVPDLQLVLCEPLLLALRRFWFEDAKVCETEHQFSQLDLSATPLAHQMADTAEAELPEKKQPCSRRWRQWDQGSLTTANGRIGPFSKLSVNIFDTKHDIDAALGNNLFHRQVRSVQKKSFLNRRLTAMRRRFELFTGFSEELGVLEAQVSMGALHMLQVGPALNGRTFIEEIRTMPYATKWKSSETGRSSRRVSRMSKFAAATEVPEKARQILVQTVPPPVACHLDDDLDLEMQALPLSSSLESVWPENGCESPTGGAGRLQESKALSGCCLDPDSLSLWNWRSLCFCPTTTGGCSSSRQLVERMPSRTMTLAAAAARAGGDRGSQLATNLPQQPGGDRGISPSSPPEAMRSPPPPLEIAPNLVPQNALPSWEMSCWMLKEKTLSESWLLHASEAWRSNVDRCRRAEAADAAGEPKPAS